MRFSLVVVSLLGLIAAASADAKLITYDVDGSVLDCDYGGGCDAFAEQTGLPPPTDGNWADFGLTFTLDTAAQYLGKLGSETGFHLGDNMQGRVYLVDTAGAGLSISIGALTLFSSKYYLAMGSEEVSDGHYANAFRLTAVYPGYPEYWFEFGTFSSMPFSAFSISELVQAPLAEFDRMALNPSSCAVRIAMPEWTVCGARSMTITSRSVPEPSAIALFCFGLAALVVSHRRSRR
jgi:hypothetical protein